MENKILAVVDGRNITQSDVFHLIQSIGQNAAAFQGAEGQKQLLDELVMQELLYSDALKQGLQDEEDFKSALEEMKKSLLGISFEQESGSNPFKTDFTLSINSYAPLFPRKFLVTTVIENSFLFSWEIKLIAFDCE